MSLFYDPTEAMFRWARGDNPQLSPHFWAEEFTCACGRCISQKISAVLVILLERVRAHTRAPIHITSGFRCTQYQSKLKAGGAHTAKLLSQHEVGNAADVRSGDMGKLREVVEKLFGDSAIGVAASFVHLDTRSDRPRRWEYP